VEQRYLDGAEFDAIINCKVRPPFPESAWDNRSDEMLEWLTA
jgi:hypothetical protein